MIQKSVDHTYLDFTTKVAAARKTTPEKIDAVAQGRVWTGTQAKERGLVDTIGLFGDAVRSAATRAKLGDKPRVVYIEREPGKFAQLVEHAQRAASRACVGAQHRRAHRRALGVAPSLVARRRPRPRLGRRDRRAQEAVRGGRPLPLRRAPN